MKTGIFRRGLIKLYFVVYPNLKPEVIFFFTLDIVILFFFNFLFYIVFWFVCLSFFKIWLHRVLVVVCGLPFSCGT